MSMKAERNFNLMRQLRVLIMTLMWGEQQFTVAVRRTGTIDRFQKKIITVHDLTYPPASATSIPFTEDKGTPVAVFLMLEGFGLEKVRQENREKKGNLCYKNLSTRNIKVETMYV